ncbi:HDIG domain-containing protein [bacterium]|nr:MAG: HDIG domain-containing protein [bacterium]
MSFFFNQAKKFFPSEAAQKKAGLSVAGLVMLVVVCVLATALAGPGIRFAPVIYSEGEISQNTVRALQDYLVVDEEATLQRRREAPNLVPSVYDLNGQAMEQSLQLLTESLASVFEPPVSGPETAEKQPVSPPSAGKIAQTFRDRWSIVISGELAQTVARAEGRKELYRLVGENLRPYYERGVVANRDLLMREAGRGSGVIVKDLQAGEERPLSELAGTVDFDTARSELLGSPAKSATSLEKLSGILAAELLRPNLAFNQEETALRRKSAAESVSPVYYQVRRGEIIVREGDKVTADQSRKLAGYVKDTGNDGPVFLQNLGLFLSLFALCLISYEFGKQNIKKVRTSPRDLLFLSSLFILLLAIQRLGMYVGVRLEPDSAEIIRFALPMGAAFIVARMVLNSETVIVFALPYIAAASVCAGLESGFFLPLIAGGLLGGHFAGGAYRRIDFFRIGAIIGLVQAFAVTLILLQKGTLFTPAAPWPVIGAFFGGVLSAILGMTLVPLAESAFGYTTDMRLMELASLDHPLLKDMMLHAPGTYHHSVVVGTLVKGAAEAIGARAVLAMVAAYYHDVGKVAKPNYFIENQPCAKNPHDKLSPSMSALILTSHVKEGVEMAEKYKLGREITDIISQHHGTRIMAYFHEKAQAQAKPGGGGEVSEQEFRYLGPKPQTREAALVMLADVAEAAVRSLQNATQPRIQGAVQNMINRVFAEGQLDECDLALKDLHKIARSFTHILTAMHHHRIDYPAPVSKDKKEDGDMDSKRQPEGGRGRTEAGPEGHESLKRLGI